MTTTEKQLMDAVEDRKRELDEAKVVLQGAKEVAESATMKLGNAIADAAHSNLLSLASLLSLSRYMVDGSPMYMSQMRQVLERAAPDFVSEIRVGVTDINIAVSWSDDIDVEAMTDLIEATREYRVNDQYFPSVTLSDTSGEDVFYRWKTNSSRSIFAVDRCAGGRVVEEDIFDGVVEARTLAEHVVTTWTAEHHRSELEETARRAAASAQALLAELAELPVEQWPDEVAKAVKAIETVKHSR